MKSSKVSAKNSRVASRKKQKKKKKTVKKKKLNIKKEEKPTTNLPKAQTTEADISEHFAHKETLKTTFHKFGEGKKVIEYLFEDSKETTDHEMFQFLILTNQFYSENLLR